MPDIRVTKVQSLVELDATQEVVTKNFALVEINQGTVPPLLVTKAFALIEINNVFVYVTKMFALTEIASVAPFPVTGRDNITVYLNDVDITDWVRRASLGASIKPLSNDVVTGEDVLGSRPSIAAWTSELGGDWSSDVEALLGPLADTHDFVNFAFVIGKFPQSVTYEWIGTAYISTYSIVPDLPTTLSFNVKMQLNGAPKRSSFT